MTSCHDDFVTGANLLARARRDRTPGTPQPLMPRTDDSWWAVTQRTGCQVWRAPAKSCRDRVRRAGFTSDWIPQATTSPVIVAALPPPEQ